MKKYKETEYSKKLRDPRWQKKRLEIMQRDEFTCQSCFDSESPLNVHHCYYEYGNDPWGYPDKSLVTLCESCHEIETIEASNTKSDLIKILSQQGFLSSHFHELCTGFIHFEFKCPEYESTVWGWALSAPEIFQYIVEQHRQHCKQLADSFREGKKDV